MKEKYHILLAEDEDALGMIVKESLESKGFEVIWSKDGIDAEYNYNRQSPDLVILDVMMPKKNGFLVAKAIRAHDKETPIIFLTAKNQTKDVVKGFEHGGNDYLKKPFSIEELIVRMNSLLLRKIDKSKKQKIQIGEYSFNYIKQKLVFKNKAISLTHRESELLYHLVKNQNEILERSYILKKIWGDDDFFNARSMDVFISKLRKKLKQDPNIQIINIRSIGYKLTC